MSNLSKQDNSEDEFESADEGESTIIPIVKSTQTVKEKLLSPVTDGWDSWNVDDDSSKETTNKFNLKQDSASSLSSSPSKTGGSLSRNGSDEDEQIKTFDQHQLQRKKLRKKPFELNQNKDDKQIHTGTSHLKDNHHDDSSITKHNVKDAYHVLDRLAAQSPTQTPNWHKPWSNFGSFLSTAKQSVSTLTSTVSEGFNAVIESVEAGLGAPDPQQLAEMDRMAFKIKGETSDSEDEPESTNVQTEKIDSFTNQDGWLNALSLEKLTNTGMKVVTGGLDVLETVGKKTFDVINEANPDLKGTRRLLIQQNPSTLSEVIREAQHEKETKTMLTKNEPVTFVQLFEKYQGIVHFEALESLSNQSSIILQTMSYGNENLLENISTYFEIDEDELTLNSLTIDEDNEQDIPSLDVLSQKFTAYQTQLRSTVPVDKLLEVYDSANQFIKEWEWTDTELDQKTLADEAINSLSMLCASIVEYYHKTAELFLMGCKSLTSFSIDVELLAIYRKQQENFSSMLSGIPNLFAKHMKHISNTSIIINNNTHNNGNEKCDSKLKQKLLNQMFIQSSSSQTYASDAYLLLKPIISQSILYHTSTTR